MKISKLLRNTTVVLAIAGALGGLTMSTANAAQTPDLPLSSDPAMSAAQQDVFKVIDQYEKALNSKNTDAILKLFSDNSVAEWNKKQTYATTEQRRDGYNALFRIATFNTAFFYDSIDVSGDTAVVRTHHPLGATVVENDKKVKDYNREVFVLHKVDGAWKIALYTFNTDPVQGEG
jgi:ketosteroid isomerase-like protein